MAVILMDGCEWLQVSNGPAHPQYGFGTHGTFSVVNNVGRDGIGLSWGRTANLGAVEKYGFTSGSDTIYGHLGLKAGAQTWNPGITWFGLLADARTVEHIALCFDATGHLQARRTTNGTVLATSTQVIDSVFSWMSIQFKMRIHDTLGEVVVKVNGVEWINVTNVDTRNGGTSTTPDGFLFYFNNDTQWMDDIFICDTTGPKNNSWTGDVSIKAIVPVGDGANSGLTGSDGNQVANWQQVDELPAASADYNGSATIGALDTYDMTPVNKTGTVLATQSFAFAANSDAGARSMKHVARSGAGTLLKSSAVALSTTYVMKAGPVLETDADGTDWTVAKVDAHEFGFEVA